jgi:enoyl-CoA hydratase/carnithine racemase
VTDVLPAGAPVRLEVDAGVSVVTVENPPVNALTNATLIALGDVATMLSDAPEVRAVVLTGAGERAFMAGADLDEFRAALADGEWIEDHTALTRRVFGLWGALPQPLVAAVQASAVGGGLEVVLLCDIVVADPRARFGFPEVTLGLIPGAGGTQRLPRRIPASTARELLLLGFPIDVTRAAQIGLVNRISAPGDAIAEAKETARQLAALPARAVQAVKQALRSGDEELCAGLDRELKLFLDVLGSEDAREGLTAFAEKRAPVFRHR